MENKISRASLGRVPLYYRFLETLPSDTIYISSSFIAESLSLGAVQVRKDLASLAGTGKPKIGYNREELQARLKSYLDNDDGGTVIVGAGKLGMALLNYKGFEEYGLDIMAAFDHHPKKIEGYTGKKVFHNDELREYCRNNNVKIGIITVPASAAQEIFDYMYDCGIRRYLCFAPIHLQVPKDAVIQYENMALSLAHLKQHK